VEALLTASLELGVGEVGLLGAHAVGDALDVGAVEGEVAEQHGVENDPDAERVELKVLVLSVKHLRRHLIGSALEAAGRRPDALAKAEVHDLDLVDVVLVDLVCFELDEDVLEFEVTVDELILVHV